MSDGPNWAQLEEAVRNTFWDYLGCRVERADGKIAVVSLDVLPHHLNHIGILHGGVHATLIDSAMGLVAMLARPEISVVTVSLHLNYVAPMQTGRLTVEAAIAHMSRKLITVQASAFNEQGELLCLGTGTFRTIEKKSGARDTVV